MFRIMRTLALFLIGMVVLISPARGSAQTAGPKPDKHVAGELLTLAQEAAQAKPGPAFRSGNDMLMLNRAGTAVLVRITARDVGRLRPALESRGFEAFAARPDLHFVEGYLPIAQITTMEPLASQGLLGVLAVPRPETAAGLVTSQGDFVHEADRVRASSPAYDGSGLRIGILSDSFNLLGGMNTGIGSGDLPPGIDIRLEGPSGNDEGRAMAELIHDLAPGAALGFASAFYGEAAFADSIRDLADPTGGACQVVVDDIIYLTEPMFQDGVIAQAIDQVVTTRQTAYFGAAGNQARRAYESTNFATAVDPLLGNINAHDFDPGPGVDTRQNVTIPAGGQIAITLQWDDPFYTISGVDTDLDIYLVTPGGNDLPSIVASSINDNIANQTPNEWFAFTNPSNTSPSSYELVIELYAGPAPGRIKYVNFRSALTNVEFATNSPTLSPHTAAANARSVAAVHYYDQANPASFTSAGPATILFAADGTPQAAEVRQKPDLAAVQGTDTTFFGSDADGNGFPNFFGTSAAAPHAAAITALVRQANPGFTPAQVYGRLASTAQDLGPIGPDDLTGAGLLNAYDAVFGPVVPAALDFSDGLESGVLSSAWETRTNGAGRIRVTTANSPAAGSYHVVLDSARDNYFGLNELVLHVNASGSTKPLILSFDQREFGDEDHPMPETFSGSGDYDGVAMSTDGTNWVRLTSLTGITSTNSYQGFDFDLSQVAADHGLTLGSDLRVKFQQYDNGRVTADGFAFDNITIAFANQAPVLDNSGAPTLPAIDEDVSNASNSGVLVADLIAGIASDPDGDPALGIAVTAVDGANGAWQFSTDSGGSWTNFGAVSGGSARLLAGQARIRFVPALNFNGLVDPGLTFRAWDQTKGSSGGTADATSNGGATAFSSASETASIEVTPVNDPPAVAKPIPDQTATLGASFNYRVPAGTFVDVDQGDALTYTATLEGGDALPGWLLFAPETQTFSGRPPAIGTWSIAVTAADGDEASATDTFSLEVDQAFVYLPIVGH